ncbi:MAG: outer membrane protein [Oleiphilaceae bacterium]
MLDEYFVLLTPDLSALEATLEGYNVGRRNIVEVLNTEKNYYTSLRGYAIARFEFVESNLRIKRSAETQVLQLLRR